MLCAAGLVAFCAAWEIPSLIGQFLLNLTMPVTLWQLYRALPREPGFSFGLAASALWPGAFLGKVLNQSGAAPQPYVIVSFLFGFAAILWAEKKLKEKGGSDPC